MTRTEFEVPDGGGRNGITRPSQGTELELRAHKVREGAPEALRSLLYALQGPEVGDVFYAIRSRVKTVDGILDKVARKRGGDPARPEYEPDHITDIVGLRIVTLFREDVIEALKIFLKMIKHEEPFDAHSPFVKAKLGEAIIYHSAPEIGDPEAIIMRLRSIVEAAGFSSVFDAKQVDTGYSSVHLVAFCVSGFGRNGGPASGIPVEIQIRTVFEDAWGEIDHKLRYANERRTQATETLLHSWQPHLNVLKTFVDGCSQYAGVIKKQALARKHPYFSTDTFSNTFVPVDKVDDAFKQMGKMPDEVRAAFVNAYTLRESAIAQRNLQQFASSETSEKFLEAAAAFEAVSMVIGNSQFEDAKALAGGMFFARMERAFCLLSTANSSDIGKAIQIYVEIQEQFPKDPIPYYRHGVALAELDEFETADAKYIQAQNALDADRNIPSDHWIRSTLPRRRGFLFWLRANQCSNDAAGKEIKRKLLREACAVTEHAMGRNKPKSIGYHSSVNNQLCYLLELNALAPPEGEAHDGRTQEEIGRYLAILESAIDLSKAPRDKMSWVDTICRARIAMKDFSGAVAAAERIEHILASVAPNGQAEASGETTYHEIIANLNVPERSALDHALWVLRNYGPEAEKVGT